MPTLPLVSIGLPVYNAERYLSQALDSLLGQDYLNVELIVSDNASEDGTEQICRQYALRDSRLRYYRAPINMGAVWNFNRVFELAGGEYFMWAAFDDLRAPHYVSACVARIEASPEAALCCTGIVFIDEGGLQIDVPDYRYGFPPTTRSARDRLCSLARSTQWFDIYGLIRSSVLRQTRGVVPTWGSDVVVLVELCLRGPVLVVPEPLFSSRVFKSKTQEDLAAALTGPGQQRSVSACWSCMTVEMVRSIWRWPGGTVRKFMLTVEFLFIFCVLNRPVGAGIRKDLTVNLRRALSEGKWRMLATLIALGVLIYPLHNRATRAVYRLFRRALVRPDRAVTTPPLE